MITNITEQRIAELRRQIAVMESLIAQGRDPHGSYRALLETSKRDLAGFESSRRTIAPPTQKPVPDAKHGREIRIAGARPPADRA
jgi:hypothetical protein